jgi:hypothetical protein
MLEHRRAKKFASRLEETIRPGMSEKEELAAAVNLARENRKEAAAYARMMDAGDDMRPLTSILTKPNLELHRPKPLSLPESDSKVNEPSPVPPPQYANSGLYAPEVRWASDVPESGRSGDRPAPVKLNPGAAWGDVVPIGTSLVYPFTGKHIGKHKAFEKKLGDWRKVPGLDLAPLALPENDGSSSMIQSVHEDGSATPTRRVEPGQTPRLENADSDLTYNAMGAPSLMRADSYHRINPTGDKKPGRGQAPPLMRADSYHRINPTEDEKSGPGQAPTLTHANSYFEED